MGRGRGQDVIRRRSPPFRLGSSHYPHLKLQVTENERDGSLVFAVDTHDAMQLEACIVAIERREPFPNIGNAIAAGVRHESRAAVGNGEAQPAIGNRTGDVE